MPSAPTHDPGIDAAGPPPTRLDGVSLFFDFDGTLVELAPTPDGVVVGDHLHAALEALAGRMTGRVAIVSGRSLEQLDRLLGDFATRIAVAGSHGAERRCGDLAGDAAVPSAALTRAAAELADYAERRGLFAERKTLGLALHYRRTPEAEAEAVAAAEAIAARHGVVLQRGKMMVELRADGDKGQAVAALMRTPAMAGTTPLFFGDDVTDEDGFAAAAALGGAGVLVGDPRATHARYRLADVGAVTAWIDLALEDAT